MVYVDFHCHLQHQAFAKGIHRRVERMIEKNVIAINTGFNLEGNKKALEHYNEYPKRLYPAIGLSPHDVPKSSLETELEFIEQNAEKAIAIGEIGLDRHHFKTQSEWDAQEKAFVAQLELAERLKKPVVVHSRNAEKEVIEILKSFKNERVMHFFLLPKLMDACLDAGLYLSIPTLKSKEQKKLFRDVPLERMVLETDSPYGINDTTKRNEPANVITSYERVAEIKKMPLKEIELIIFDNFKTITSYGMVYNG